MKNKVIISYFNSIKVQLRRSTVFNLIRDTQISIP